ncbi:hypothetical protein ATANTOWER_012551, partial [Ataeniobius toweri]|nr:hypothetical protein [Ataeniobius toweri]
MNIKMLAQNRCCSHSALHEPVSLSSCNLKFLMSCNTTAHPKHHLHLWIFSEHTTYSCHALTWGKWDPIHCLYPFHLHSGVDQGPLDPGLFPLKRFTLSRRDSG